MEHIIKGIHHITAIAGSANRNHDFYTRILGLRMVKKTVNFDDPKTYHLYYGDEKGTPGCILTFFPWGEISAGRRAGEILLMEDVTGKGHRSRNIKRAERNSLFIILAE